MALLIRVLNRALVDVNLWQLLLGLEYSESNNASRSPQRSTIVGCLRVLKIQSQVLRSLHNAELLEIPVPLQGATRPMPLLRVVTRTTTCSPSRDH